MWPHVDQYPRHYLKCQAAAAAADSFVPQQAAPSNDCDLRLRGIPRPPPPPQAAYYPSQVTRAKGTNASPHPTVPQKIALNI